MHEFLAKPKSGHAINPKGKYENFNLEENPFPTEPVVNKDSSDRRINGDIYAMEIRNKEYSQIETSFLQCPQSDLNHTRLGYICDESYIGRGNGKSAFLVNLYHKINQAYCMDISKELNKCFALYVVPEPGGRTKSFASFVDLIFSSIVKDNIIDMCLATLRLNALVLDFPDVLSLFNDDPKDKIIQKLTSRKWFEDSGFKLAEVNNHITENEFIQKLSPDFPLDEKNFSPFLTPFTTSSKIIDHYQHIPIRGKDRLDFIFTQLTYLFMAADFNGAYILVDDFERIPDFQSARQKRDFAFELRSCLYDGIYANSKYGFFNMILTLHAGVPQLISDAWVHSGLEHRSPVEPKIQSQHVVSFEKMTNDHVKLLLKTYLDAYRITPQVYGEELKPFTEKAIVLIAEMSEFNAAKILRSCYDLLDQASRNEETTLIDEKFVKTNSGVRVNEKLRIPVLDNEGVTDLLQKAADEE